jgi:hypothetical protein
MVSIYSTSADNPTCASSIKMVAALQTVRARIHRHLLHFDRHPLIDAKSQVCYRHKRHKPIVFQASIKKQRPRFLQDERLANAHINFKLGDVRLKLQIFNLNCGVVARESQSLVVS